MLQLENSAGHISFKSVYKVKDLVFHILTYSAAKVGNLLLIQKYPKHFIKNKSYKKSWKIIYGREERKKDGGVMFMNIRFKSAVMTK